MHAAVNVGVMMPFVVIHCVDDGLRPLRRGAVVQIDQWLAVHQPRENRELGARGLDVEGAVGAVGLSAAVGLSEGGVCHRNFRCVCESGSWLISVFSMAARAEFTDMPVSTSARKA